MAVTLAFEFLLETLLQVAALDALAPLVAMDLDALALAAMAGVALVALVAMAAGALVALELWPWT